MPNPARRKFSILERIDTSGRIDATAGVIRGVKILGRESLNGREYTPEAMAKALPLYEGVRVNLDHPDKATPNAVRSMNDWIGNLENVQAKADGLYGDLRLIKSHPMSNAILEAAAKSPTQFGLSHNADCTGTFKGGKQVIDAIEAVRSVDIVQRPATTKGLFESEDSMDGMTALGTPATDLDTTDDGCDELPGYQQRIINILNGSLDVEGKLGKIRLVLKAQQQIDALSAEVDPDMMESYDGLRSVLGSHKTGTIDRSVSVLESRNSYSDSAAKMLKAILPQGQIRRK